MPLTQEDLPTAFDSTTCVKRGLCPVSKIRGHGSRLESHSLYFEQHGRGLNPDFKVVFIMGLNSSCFGWGPQVRHFGVTTTHTILAFDNRGVGNSGYPRGPYTTSAMAEDAIALLDHIGWTAKRDLHIVGISLGGMIAQEMATRIPERIASLVLAVTTPGGRPWRNFPPWKGITSLGRLIFTPDVAKKVPIVMEMLFPKTWLDEKAMDDTTDRTNYQVQAEGYIRRVGITRPQLFGGHISQMAAGLTHYVSPERLRSISSSIPKVVIVTGDNDHLVLPVHSQELKACMPEAELVEWEDTGHAIHAQRPDRFNELLERTFREGRAMVNDR
ncbi:Alpha/Beta hydrolase protein [Infundibulicybe gibba]|nr:Alpha/Beta hydrolase protein [Infundibulicybe gibba]